MAESVGFVFRYKRVLCPSSLPAETAAMLKEEASGFSHGSLLLERNATQIVAMDPNTSSEAPALSAEPQSVDSLPYSLSSDSVSSSDGDCVRMSSDIDVTVSRDLKISMDGRHAQAQQQEGKQNWADPGGGAETTESVGEGLIVEFCESSSSEQQDQTIQKQQSQQLQSFSLLNAKAPEFIPKAISKDVSAHPCAIVPPVVRSMPPLHSSPRMCSIVPQPLRSPPGVFSGWISNFPPSPPSPRFVPASRAHPSAMIPGPGIGPRLMPSPHPPGGVSHMPGQAPPLPVLPPYMVAPPMVIPGHPSSGHMPESLPSQSVSMDTVAVRDGNQAPGIDLVAVPGSASKAVLTDELKSKIVKQVEFHFSDENLPMDSYLMKFVKRDPEGFVPIPVVASLRNVKNLVKNHALVAAALRSSAQLVVSDDGKKVRRLQPIPDIDVGEIQSRTVVADNLPEDHSISKLETLFGIVGNVKKVQICQPEASNGINQSTTKYPSTNMLVSNKLHALVEYETVEQADRAVAELTDERNWRSGLRVRKLVRHTFYNKHMHQGGRFPANSWDASGSEENGPPLVNGVCEKSKEDCVEQLEELQGYDSQFNENDGSKRGRGHGRGCGRGRGHHHLSSGRSHPLGTSYLSNVNGVEMKPPPGPRMPDGTRGFSMGRGKLSSSNIVLT